MDIDDLFIKAYLNDVSEKERKKILLSQEDRVIAKQKKDKLDFIAKFLQKFVDLEVYVNHSDQYTKNTRTMDGIEPQKFSFYYVDSSKTWAPGISIWLDHPAIIEIAIPNKPQEDGIVVIKVASHHPDSYLLEQHFTNYASACEALGRFLGKCTTSIGKDPTKYLKEIEHKKHANIDKKTDSNIHNEQPEPHLNRKHSLNEIPILKDTNDSTLKKISSLFNLNKDTHDDDD
jgi:hypothetical protein